MKAPTTTKPSSTEKLGKRQSNPLHIDSNINSTEKPQPPKDASQSAKSKIEHSKSPYSVNLSKRDSEFKSVVKTSHEEVKHSISK